MTRNEMELWLQAVGEARRTKMRAADLSGDAADFFDRWIDDLLIAAVVEGRPESFDKPVPASFKAEVIADSSGTWAGNGLRFATRAEAEVYAKDLYSRWTAVKEWRVVESTDPVNR